jgi:hypothetical protein
MVKIDGSNERPLHVFLKRQGQLKIHMKRGNYLLKLNLEEIPHLVETLVYHYVATGGSRHTWQNLRNTIYAGVQAHQEYNGWEEEAAKSANEEKMEK